MAWLAGWTYRKSITLSRASGAVTNYQMPIPIGETSGAVGESVDCNGHAKSDFSDLRFTTSDGTTLLDYWIEVVVGTTPNQLAWVWVEFDSIGTTNTTFYMYYGKADASSVSNGINTFIQFDDFEWGSDEDNIDTSGGGITWSKTTAGSSTAKIDTGQKYTGAKSLRLYRAGANSPNAYFSQALSTEIAFRFRIYKETAAALGVYYGDGTKTFIDEIYPTTPHIYANEADTGVDSTNGAWHLIDISDIDLAVPKQDLYHDGSIAKDNAGAKAVSWANGILVFQNNAGTSNLWIDTVIVRNWRATEPAWGSWGTEEELHTFTTSASVDAAIQLSGIPVNVSIDSLLKLQAVESEVGIDAILLMVPLVMLDALIQSGGVLTSAVLDAVLSTISRSVIDALIQRIDITESISVDGVIGVHGNAPTTNLDAMVGSSFVPGTKLDAIVGPATYQYILIQRMY